MKKRKGFTLIELLVVIAIVALLMSILVPALNRAKTLAQRLVCGSNLKGIGNALGVYAGENLESITPVAGVPRTAPATGKNRLAHVRAGLPPDEWGAEPGARWTQFGVLTAPYNSDPDTAFTNGATITSSLYLLIRYTKITPNQFNCPGDTSVMKFSLDKMAIPPMLQGQLTIYNIWDFGDGTGATGNVLWPGEFCSYSYHMPYVSPTDPTGLFMSYGISENSNPGSPVCADRNPFLDSHATNAEVPTRPADLELIGIDRSDNSVCHGDGEGQNVLFKDNSVSFHKTPNVGLREDHIYTYDATREIREGGSQFGTRPLNNGDGGPKGFKDAYLVGEKNG
jgi:prepilin-type N-terminal cleavage/methylation domain-containing protein